MLDQLIKIAQENLSGISRNIPELNDLDSKQVTDITSQTVVGMIMQQARKGNVGSLREMLSGKSTTDDHISITRLKDPVIKELMGRLNISEDSAAQLAMMALPVIMNMLNNNVQHAQTGGADIHSSLNTIKGTGNGLIDGILNVFGRSNQNTKLINGILQTLIR